MVLRRFSFLLLLIGLLACKETKEENKTIVVTTTESEKAGKLTFDNTCAICHGEDGTKGLGGASDLALSPISKDSAISVVSSGRGAMMSYSSSLDEKEIEDVVNYLQLLKSAK